MFIVVHLLSLIHHFFVLSVETCCFFLVEQDEQEILVQSRLQATNLFTQINRIAGSGAWSPITGNQARGLLFVNVFMRVGSFRTPVGGRRGALILSSAGVDATPPTHRIKDCHELAAASARSP